MGGYSPPTVTVFKVDIKKHEVDRKETYIGVGFKPPRRGTGTPHHLPLILKQSKLGGDSSPSS